MLIKRAKEILAENERNNSSLKSLYPEIEELTKRLTGTCDEFKSIFSAVEKLTTKDFEEMSSEFESLINQVQLTNMNFKFRYREIKEWLDETAKMQDILEELLDQHRNIFK